MIVTVAENVTVEIFPRHEYKEGTAYRQKNVCGYNRAMVIYWKEPIMDGWRWSIVVCPNHFDDETLVMGVLRDTLEECVIAAYCVIETEHFAKMLTAWPAESLK